jgi:hypothetical protein
MQNQIAGQRRYNTDRAEDDLSAIALMVKRS